MNIHDVTDIDLVNDALYINMANLTASELIIAAALKAKGAGKVLTIKANELLLSAYNSEMARLRFVIRS